MPHFNEIPKLDFEVERIPVNATRQIFSLESPVNKLIERVDKLIELLEEPSSVIISGKKAIAEYHKLTGV